MMDRLKFPALIAAAALLAAGCGGDAESAPDLEGMPHAEDDWALEEGSDFEAQPPPVEVPEREPVRSAPAPAPQRPAPAPAQPGEPSTPPPAVVEEPAPEPAPAPSLAEGTLVTANLQSALSTRTSQEGDTFRARVAEDVRGPDGRVLVPAGTIVEGSVTESRRSSDRDAEAVLSLSIDALVLDGARLPLVASIAEVDLDASTADSATRTAAKVATGAAAGAVVGRILGRDTRSTVGGAAVGAAAGAGVALSTRDGHASIEEGARIVIRVDQPVILAGAR